MKDNPFVSAFVPKDIDEAADSVKLFILFLFHELDGDNEFGRHRYRWLSDLHGAAAGEQSQNLPGGLF
jgi:hypothetical protein